MLLDRFSCCFFLQYNLSYSLDHWEIFVRFCGIFIDLFGILLPLTHFSFTLRQCLNFSSSHRTANQTAWITHFTRVILSSDSDNCSETHSLLSLAHSHQFSMPRIEYTCDELISIRIEMSREEMSFYANFSTSHMLCNYFPLLSRSHNRIAPKQKKRGCRAGLRVKNRRRKFRQFVPAVLFSNCQSLNNKIDQFRLNCRVLREYRNSDFICFCETWLDSKISDNLLEIENFSFIRSDRTIDSGKSKGGGLIVYTNDSFSRDVKIHFKLCSPEIELLVLNIRPFYLPREFTNIFLFVIYIPPRQKRRWR